jgi:outer membrane receptor protein involved in Fe transport
VYSGSHGTASLFYNKNETFSPVFTIDRRLATFGQRFPNRVTETDEFGVKADLWNGRFALTASIFDTTQNNGLQSFPDEDGSITGSPISTYVAPTGLRTTKGWEIDLNIRPLPGVDLLLSYGDVEAETESGGRVEAVPDRTFAMLGRYEFEHGGMQGASATWIYNYWGSSMLGSRTNWELPSGSLHTLVLGYTLRERSTLLPGRWSARLRIENIFDKPSVLPATFETAVGVTKPRNYRLGISYEF